MNPSPHREAHQHRSYLPGMGWHSLLPFYDVVQRVLGMPAVHRQLVDRAGLRGGYRVLDVGCGTGNLLAALGRRHPDVDTVGIDPDERALAKARRKLGRRPVRLDQGLAEELPYPDATFDRVLSTIMFHHLDEPAKDRMLAEVRRVLVPGGMVLLADFGHEVEPADGWLSRLIARSPRLPHNHGDDIPPRMSAAGLVEPIVLGSCRTRMGRVTVFRAEAP